METVRTAEGTQPRPTWLPARAEAERRIKEYEAEQAADGVEPFRCGPCGAAWPDGEPWCLACGHSNAD